MFKTRKIARQHTPRRGTPRVSFADDLRQLSFSLLLAAGGTVIGLAGAVTLHVL